MRKEFEMDDKQLKRILAACKPVPYLVIGGVEPRTPQENANAAWAEIGRELGFEPLTVKAIEGKEMKFFTAKAIEEKPIEEALAEAKPSEAFLVPSTPGKKPADKVSQVAQQAIQMRDGSLKYFVKDDAQYQTATNGLKKIKGVRKMIKDLLDPMVKAAYDAYKKNADRRKEIEAPLDEAERHLKTQMAKYVDEKERERLAAEKKAQDEAAEKMREAEKAADEGRHTEADIAMEEAAQMEDAPPPVISAPTVIGAHSTKRWGYEILDPDQVPREYLMVDEKKIGAIARSTKNTEKAPIIPGVKFFLKTGIAVR